ncbi:hypothetical protein [Neorhodopirellula pilleata]|uniref:Uncharacterized protein n=1 Tax=Neorhodopirellula pilleata TaxID=2714738 RepID=A0A5C6ABR9_9BACT|nr:hypothetical protein [Neorhodopirellula pilleata]TWT96511.1 hypothetical protein Pla100_29940 [Neorhodopirellula pilleata]
MSNRKLYRIKLTDEERETFAKVATGKRGKLAFTRNPRLRAWIEVLVTCNTRVKRRGFSSFLNKSQIKLRLIED